MNSSAEPYVLGTEPVWHSPGDFYRNPQGVLYVLGEGGWRQPTPEELAAYEQQE